MSTRFVSVNRNQALLLPPDLRDWVPEDDLVHREHFDVVAACFVQVLELARETGLLRVWTVSVDGTKLRANASINRNVRYDRAGQLIEQLELEVKELLEKAERADEQDQTDGQQLPEELCRRENLKAKLKTDEGRKRYAVRKHTVEPVFGIIKDALGFRRFTLRGLANVSGEWHLMALAYNLKRLHVLRRAKPTPANRPNPSSTTGPRNAGRSFMAHLVLQLRLVWIKVRARIEIEKLSPTGC